MPNTIRILITVWIPIQNLNFKSGRHRDRLTQWRHPERLSAIWMRLVSFGILSTFRDSREDTGSRMELEENQNQRDQMEVEWK